MSFSCNPKRLTPPLSLAVLISGSGRSLVNLQQQIQAGLLPARIAVVVSSRSDVAGVIRARELGLPVEVVERKALTREEFQRRITQAVAGVDLVCMAGFLSLWHVPPEFTGRVINIHPALLPEFGGRGMYGHHVHAAVIAAGRHESGCTVHFCNNEYDCGPVILQRRVPVLPNDTPESLAARVFEQELIAYPEAIRQLAAAAVRGADGRVISMTGSPPNR